MTLAAEARAAVRSCPFLFDALRAGVVNYAAAARRLDVGDDTEAVATALRRFARELSRPEVSAREVRVTMHTGLESTQTSPDDALLSLNSVGFTSSDGPLTGVLAVGDVDADALDHVLGLLSTNTVSVEAAAVAGEALFVVVDRSEGVQALRLLEEALSSVPTSASASS